jgi:ComF family protein
MIYNDGSRRLVLAFKHADRIDAAPAWGEWLARAGADLLADADFLVPVPLHHRRLISRRYNQAALMAQALGRTSGLPVVVDALRRVRATPSQGRMNRSQRERNVAGAFAVRASRQESIRDARIVLVDDVITTGATLTACIRPLLHAGAANVDVLTLARVTRTG